MSEWCTIESDPGVFTALIQEIGVEGVSVEEMYDIDQQLPQKVYGLIFLFKYVHEQRQCLINYDPNLFFANQTITNACATQAILQVLLNQDELNIGEELNTFKQFTQDMDSQTKGLVIGNSEKIRLAHNSFKRIDPFYFEDNKSKKSQKEDAFHFIAYIQKNGKVYELDGLQQGPILLDQIQNNQNWLDIAKQEIQKRILKYSQSEIRFNLMAVIPNRRQEAQKKINQIQKEKLTIYNIFQKNNLNMKSYQKDYESLQNVQPIQNYMEQSIDDLKTRLNILDQQNEEQNYIVQNEIQKEIYQKVENQRRKFDYTPFIIELLKKTTEKGLLENLINKAKKN